MIGAPMLVRVFATRHAVLALLLAALSACGPSSTTPTLTLLDPRHGHQVPVICQAVDVDDCTAAAAEMLRYLPSDAAKAEGVRVEPLPDAPAGANIAVRVTMDHEMFLASGEQPYRVIQQSAGDEFDIEVILDN